MLKITFLGHACFLLDDGETKVLTDPYLSGNPLAAVSPDEVESDYIFVSHGHGDHVGDAPEIAARCGAAVGGQAQTAEGLHGCPAASLPVFKGDVRAGRKPRRV